MWGNLCQIYLQHLEMGVMYEYDFSISFDLCLMSLSYSSGCNERKYHGQYDINFWACEMQIDFVLWLLADEWGISPKGLPLLFYIICEVLFYCLSCINYQFFKKELSYPIFIGKEWMILFHPLKDPLIIFTNKGGSTYWLQCGIQKYMLRTQLSFSRHCNLV